MRETLLPPRLSFTKWCYKENIRRGKWEERMHLFRQRAKWKFAPRSNESVALTVRYKMLWHVEGDLDGERAGVLRGVDNGNDTCADGDQRQGDLIQRAVRVACRWRERKKVKVNVPAQRYLSFSHKQDNENWLYAKSSYLLTVHRLSLPKFFRMNLIVLLIYEFNLLSKLDLNKQWMT